MFSESDNSRIKVRCEGHGDPKMTRDTPPSKDTSIHQSFDSYLKKGDNLRTRVLYKQGQRPRSRSQ